MIERFAVPDQLSYYYDRPAEHANVHVEVLVSGGIDERLVRESVLTAVAAEPGLRARRAQLAAEDAAEFAGRYAKALDQLTESRAGRR